jgi:tail tube protein gp19
MGSIPRATSGRFLLNLDGVSSSLKSVEGGGIRAEVIVETAVPESFTRKHIGPPRYEDITIQCGLAMAKPLLEWIRATLDLESPRKSGSVVTLDANLNARSERQFTDALISEVGFPASDASSKEAAYLTLKFAPEFTKSVKASGKPALPKEPAQKEFLVSSFRLELDGLDCSKVNKIDPFTIKQTFASADVGDRREPVREPGRIEFPNLRVTLAESSAQTWLDWFEDFVAKGSSGDDKEKNGAIVFLSADLKSEVLRIKLGNVGIFALTPETASSADQIARVKAELYCERMEI